MFYYLNGHNMADLLEEMDIVGSGTKKRKKKASGSKSASKTRVVIEDSEDIKLRKEAVDNETEDEEDDDSLEIGDDEESDEVSTKASAKGGKPMSRARKEEKEITIKFKFDPKRAERIALISIIAILSIFIVYDKFISNVEFPSFTGTSTPAQGGAGAAVVQQNDSATNQTNQSTSQANQTTSQQNQSSSSGSSSSSDSSSEDQQLSGDVTLTITNVAKEKKTRADGSNYGKITAVTFTINNQKEAITPKVIVYAYDTGNTLFVSRARKEVTYSVMQPGSTAYRRTVEFSSQFPDISLLKTVKVVLQDSATDTTLATDSTSVTIS